MTPLAAISPGPDPVTAFVGRHQAGLWRWLRALGCEPGAADEHAQDALLAALHVGVDRLPDADAARWLRRAARNLFLMQRRHEARRPQLLSLDTVEAAWIALGGDDDGGALALQALSRCLLGLPARDRELIARRYERGQRRLDIGAALGLGDAGVKQALRRVRGRLRECVLRRLARERRDDHDDDPR